MANLQSVTRVPCLQSLRVVYSAPLFVLGYPWTIVFSLKVKVAEGWEISDEIQTYKIEMLKTQVSSYVVKLSRCIHKGDDGGWIWSSYAIFRTKLCRVLGKSVATF
jgi:hypothetical protein